MGRSISGGILDENEEVKVLTRIREMYPNAEERTLPDGRLVWTSPDVEPDRIMVVVANKGEVFFCPYELVAGRAVFNWNFAYASNAIDRLGRLSDDAYKLLVRATCES